MINTLKILLIEDEPSLRDVYEMVLSSQGHKVKTAHNGFAGIEQLKKFRPDIIILDLLMPEMDGITFLQNFDSSHYPNIKIIIYSNLFDEHTRKQVLELGADDIILKSSLSPRAFVEYIDRYSK